jgi:hypothetical protein
MINDESRPLAAVSTGFSSIFAGEEGESERDKAIMAVKIFF